MKFLIWVIIKKPFGSLLSNIREISMEIMIIITHFSFLFLSIFDNDINIKGYFAFASFISILCCILIEYIFRIIATIGSLLKILSSICFKDKDLKFLSKKINKKNKKGSLINNVKINRIS